MSSVSTIVVPWSDQTLRAETVKTLTPVAPFSAVERFHAEQGSDAAPCYVQGYATVFNRPFVYNGRIEVFRPGAFDRSLESGRPIRALLQHDSDLMLGDTSDQLELYRDQRGIAFRLQLDGSLTCRMARYLMGAGRWRAVSIGLTQRRSQLGKVGDEEVTLIAEADLNEVSICDFGVVSQAFATMHAGLPTDTLAEAAKSGRLCLERPDRAPQPRVSISSRRFRLAGSNPRAATREPDLDARTDRPDDVAVDRREPPAGFVSGLPGAPVICAQIAGSPSPCGG